MAGSRTPGSLADPATFKAGYSHIKAGDPALRPILEAKGVLKFSPEGDPFESLVESILSQQLAWSAASSIIGRVRGLFPGKRITAAKMMGMQPRRLRTAGVSPQKLSYLKDLSARVAGGRLELGPLREMPDEEIVDALDEVKGIGPWTAHMFLIFTLGRPDVLPVDDYGIRASAKVVYGLPGLPAKAELEGLAERWRPYCSVASLYLWHARDSLALVRASLRGRGSVP